MPGPQRNRAVLALTVALLLLVGAWPVATGAAPLAASSELDPSGEPYVAVEKSAVAVPSDGDLKFTVTVRIDAETSYLESRVQMRRPSGRLIYQKTQVRNDVPTGTVVFEYERPLDDLGLRPDAYPLEIRVRSDSGAVREWMVNEDLLIYDGDREPVPVVLLARFGCSLGSDPEGRFVIDPGAASRTRDELEALAAFGVARDESAVGAMIAPAVLEEWRRVSEGYEYVGPEGVETEPPDSEISQDHGTSLSLLSTALETGRVELIDVPYSDPDMVGLALTGRLDDLEPQFERGLSAYFSALETTPQPTVATAEGLLPSGAIRPLQVRDTAAAVVTSASVAFEGDAPSGAMIAEGSDLALLIVDDRASSALASAEAGAFAREVFEWHLEAEEGAPIIVEVPLGAGSPLSVTELDATVGGIFDAPWVRTISAGDAASIATETVPLRSDLAIESDAPPGYWDQVDEARTKAQALLAAAGVNDPRAQAANDYSMISQSRCWAGPDESWSFADRGRAYAAAAIRISDEVLDGVHIAAKDITLSGARGEVPVSIINPGETDLAVTLKTSSENLVVRTDPADIVTLKPSENLFSIPVDLKSSLAGTLEIEVWSDELLIDEQIVKVRASYLDRLAIIGGITVVLIVMLLYIRRRVVRAPADTMENGA
jgi:hypothetical protein